MYTYYQRLDFPSPVGSFGHPEKPGRLFLLPSTDSEGIELGCVQKGLVHHSQNRGPGETLLGHHSTGLACPSYHQAEIPQGIPQNRTEMKRLSLGCAFFLNI